MSLKSGQVWAGLIVTKDATGALSAATLGPAGTLYVNGVENAATVTVTGANPYKWSVTLPALSAGDLVSLYMTATIDGVATAEVVAEDVVDTVRVSEVQTHGDAAWATATGFAAPGDAMTLTSDYDAAKTAAQPGDAMALTGDYDAAKTAAQPGDAMMLTADEREDVSGAVWDALRADHTTGGTYGAVDEWAGAIDSQQIRDAMKLAPSAGAPAVNSIDDKIDTRAAPGDAMTLTAGERTSVAEAILESVVEGTRTVQQYLRGFAAVLLGKSSNRGADYRDPDDTKTRVDSTLDGQGNRINVILDLD